MRTKPKAKTLHQIITDISSLSDTGKRRVLAHLKRNMASDSVTVNEFIESLRDKRFRKRFACPRCNSEDVVRNST